MEDAVRENPVKVFILAGGFGTRIRSLFPDCPKPLVPIHGKPFLEWQIELLAQQGFNQFVLCVGYLADQIIQRIGDGSRWNVQIQYAIEEQPLGTGGALQNAVEYFSQTILLLNGDTYLSTDYAQLHQQYCQIRQPNTIGALSLVHRADTDRYGRVEVDTSGMITSFSARSPLLDPGWVNAGAYWLESEILKLIPPATASSLEQDILPNIVQSQQHLLGISVDSSFIDMGTPDGYSTLLNFLPA